MKRLWVKLLLVLLGLYVSSVGGDALLHAQTYERMSEAEQKLYGERAYVAADYEMMIAIKRYWYQESLKLKNRKYSFVLTGANDCVLKITLPAGELFNDNDSTLNTAADGLLRPLLKFLRGNDAIAYAIVATYSDNNGSKQYLESFTTGRSRSIARWMTQQGVLPAAVSSYGHGNNIPLTDNHNVSARRKNRRVSIYLIPNKNMLKLAKKGKLGETTVTVKK